MTSATLAGATCTSAAVTLPACGVWHAEAALDEEVDLAGRVELRIRDALFVGTVLSGGPKNGRSRYRIAGGAGQWGRSIPARDDANDATVKVSKILTDVAAAAGETLDASTLPAGDVGVHYTRAAGPASATLHRLSPGAWRVDPDGVTRIGRRPATPYTGDAVRVSVDPAAGRAELAPGESVVDLLPGAVIDSLEAADVILEAKPDGLRAYVYAGAGTSRRLTALQRIVLSVLPDLRYRGVYEFRIVDQEQERLTLQAVRSSTGLPDLTRVPVRPGVPGARADHTLGSRVLVGFVDADAARPVVLAFEDPESDGFVPDRLDLSTEDETFAEASATAAGRVVRYGDQVSIPVAGAVATGVVSIGAAGNLSRVRA